LLVDDDLNGVKELNVQFFFRVFYFVCVQLHVITAAAIIPILSKSPSSLLFARAKRNGCDES
jgi:hypothetical protein